jgi:hypothetical protein
LPDILLEPTRYGDRLSPSRLSSNVRWWRALDVSRWHVIPDEWKPRLRAYLRTTCGEDRDWLLTHDFHGDQSVHLQFDDGSFALFWYDFLTCTRGFAMAVLRGQD